MQCFEGMKAYRGPDGKVRLFRPIENMNRMKRSAVAASLPVSLPHASLQYMILLRNQVRPLYNFNGHQEKVRSTENF